MNFFDSLRLISDSLRLISFFYLQIFDPLVYVRVGLVDLPLHSSEMIGPILALTVEDFHKACCLAFNCRLHSRDLVLKGPFLQAILLWSDNEDVVSFQAHIEVVKEALVVVE